MKCREKKHRNRELIFESSDINEHLDGVYDRSGQKAPFGTYTLKIIASTKQGQKTEHVGHVNIIY